MRRQHHGDEERERISIGELGLRVWVSGREAAEDLVHFSLREQRARRLAAGLATPLRLGGVGGLGAFRLNPHLSSSYQCLFKTAKSDL